MYTHTLFYTQGESCTVDGTCANPTQTNNEFTAVDELVYPRKKHFSKFFFFFWMFLRGRIAGTGNNKSPLIGT